MLYIHSMWSEPQKNYSEEKKMKSFIHSLYSVILVKKLGYKIHLYCDKEAYNLYSLIPYDKIIIVDFSSDDINPFFWNWSKIKSQKLVNEPYVHIDNDVFLYKDVVGDSISSKKCSMIVQSVENEITMPDNFHRDYMGLNFNEVYGDFGVEWYKYNMWAYNCGVVGFSDVELKNKYLDLVYKLYLRASNENKIGEKYRSTLFVGEQMLLYYVARQNNAKVFEIIPYDKMIKYLDYGWIVVGNEIGYCHMWGQVKFNDVVVNKIVERIKKEHPEYNYVLKTVGGVYV